MTRFTTTAVILIGFCALFTSRPASAQCASTDYECHAAVICFTGSYTGWGAINKCGPNGGPVCSAWRWANGEGYNVSCTSIETRGDDDNVLADIFKAGQPVTTSEGKLIEIDQATGEMIQVATSISALQQRGAAIGADVDAAFAKAGIPVVESVDVEVADNADTGERTFTLRGQLDNEIVMRFDADGNRLKDAPDLEIGEDVRVAMEKAGSSAMSPRGGWCAQARPTTGGCAVPTSFNVSRIPGATNTPQFTGSFPTAPPSATVFSAAAYPVTFWTIPSAYDALSLVEYFNLGFIRTQSELDRFMAFCWIPNPNVAGSGSCTSNPTGVCPYDANAGVTCESMSGMTP